MYLYIILCVVQGPEVAVLDWYGPEADIGEGRGGGGGGGGSRTPGGVQSTHSRGESVGASPRIFLEFRPSYTRFSL